LALTRNNKSVSITSNNEIFDRIHYYLYDSHDKNIGFYRLHCKIYSLICAGFLLDFYDKTHVIDSDNHSVCYAGSDTWDLSLGVVLRNYQYPDLQIPRPEVIPSFDHLFEVQKFDAYYSQQGLLKSSETILHKEFKVV